MATITNNFNAPIIIKGGTLNGDVHYHGTTNLDTQDPSEEALVAMTEAEEESAADMAEDPLTEALMPIFKNVREEVAAFLRDIDGQKPTAVTEKVNALLKAEKITRAGCKGDLWRILNSYGLYRPSVQNWNSQVNA